MGDTMDQISFNFMEDISKQPEQLIDASKDLILQLKSSLKSLYDHCKNQEIKSSKSTSLPELIIKDFDNEQVWQQLELQNDSVIEQAVMKIGRLVAHEDLVFKNLEKSINENDDKCDEVLSDEHENSEDASESDEINSDLEQMNEDSSEQENEEQVTKSAIGRKSIVDDEFFKLHEMEQFLTSEEKKISADSGNEQDFEDSDEESEEEGNIDLFAEESGGSEDNEVRLAKYKDFFVSKEEDKKLKRNKFFEEFPDEDEFENQQSTLELRQNRLKNRIDEIESRVISEKPWQLQGEIKGDSRPQNSLLEEIVEFDRTTRPAPIMTGQTTVQLEDIIRQRIKDKVFDSVERKVKAVETPLEYKKKLVLDQEKSKSSLAQIYEKEYLDQQAALDPDHANKEEEEPESHKEIRSMMKILFNQLDALSNFHYTPKPSIPELRIISNIPAINMEEVAPVAASDAALLAPEEVRNKPKADILGKSERSSTDKNRERRKKKLKQRHHAQEKEKREALLQKINPGMGNKYSKEKARKLLEKVSKDTNVEKMDESLGRKQIKSSTAFFSHLQEQVQSQIKTKTEPKRKKNKNIDAKKMKL